MISVVRRRRQAEKRRARVEISYDTADESIPYLAHLAMGDTRGLVLIVKMVRKAP